MRKTTKFIASPGPIFLLVLVDSVALPGCVAEIIACIIPPENTTSIYFYLIGAFFFLALAICTTCITLKTIYIVELFEDKIEFRGVYRKYIILYSQIQCIIRRDVRFGAIYYLIVEGYRMDPNKFYPFWFERTKKTKKLVQKLRAELRLK